MRAAGENVLQLRVGRASIDLDIRPEHSEELFLLGTPVVQRSPQSWVCPSGKARDDAKTDKAKAQAALQDAVAARDGGKAKLDMAKAAQALPANAADPAKAAAKEAI